MSANPKLDQRMSFMRFDQQDRDALRALKPVIDAEISKRPRPFYGQVRAFPETRGQVP
jgi:methyl-accepting chemotaxis protein